MNTRSILRLPAAFYVLVPLLAFAPCWLRGTAYFDNDLLAQFGPWRQFLKDELMKWNFPLWNPTLMGGTPFFADPQNMLLYPFNWPTLLFPVAADLTFFFMLHMAWAGWGMHRWLRALGLSETSCRVGGLLFCLSGFFWLEIIHPPVLAAFSWLPWFFGALENSAQKPTPRRGFFTGLCLAMLFLCGSFQVFLGGLYGGLAYFLFRAWPLHKKKGLLPVALLFLWGALPLLGQLIPTAEFSALTDRRAGGQDYATTNAKLSLSPSSLHQLVLPRFNMDKGASVQEALQSLDEHRNLWPLLGYVGIWMPFLAFWAFRGRDKRIPALLAGLALLGLALSLGRHLPIHRLFHEVVPGFDLIRVPFRYLYLFSLGFSALAAFGYEAWASQKTGKSQRGPLMGALGYALLLYFVVLWRPVQDWREMTALGLGLAGILLYGLSKRHARKGPALFQAALVLPLLLSGWACFRPAPSKNFDFRGNSSMLQEVGRQWTPSRMFFLGKTYYPIEVGGKRYALPYPLNAASVLGLKNFGGYNPLALASKLDLSSLPLGTLVKLGAIRAVVSQQEGLSLPGFTVRSVPPYQVHEWQGALPYVFAPLEREIHLDLGKRLGRMAEKDFDPYRTAVLSGPLPPEIQSLCKLQSPPAARMTYALEMDGTDQQVFAVTLDKGSLVVFSETLFPGWKALLDGKPADLLTADHFLRCLYLSNGEHRVEFLFRPFWWPAVPIALAFWLVLTLAAFMTLRRKGALLA